MKPHKHAELIKAWVDGAEIEACVGPDEWWHEEKPDWHPQVAYRIKPTIKPDFSVERWVYADGSTSRCSDANIRYIFDGETKKLKSAKVIK